MQSLVPTRCSVPSQCRGHSLSPRHGEASQQQCRPSLTKSRTEWLCGLLVSSILESEELCPLPDPEMAIVRGGSNWLHLFSTLTPQSGATWDQVLRNSVGRESLTAADCTPVIPKSPSLKTKKELGEHLWVLVQRTWWPSLDFTPLE